jgi:hypothetical protein
MIAVVLSFLATRLGQMVVGGLGVVALFGWFTVSQRNIGARNAVAHIEQKAKKDVDKATSAARQSRADSASGRVQLSPYRRD